jgi:hypothetical protein
MLQFHVRDGMTLELEDEVLSHGIEYQRMN